MLVIIIMKVVALTAAATIYAYVMLATLLAKPFTHGPRLQCRMKRHPQAISNKAMQIINGNGKRRNKSRNKFRNIKLRFTTINTAGFVPGRVWEAISYMYDTGTALLILTETHTSTEEEKIWRAWETKYNTKFSVEVSTYVPQKYSTGKKENKKRGVIALWIKNKINISSKLNSGDGRYIQLQWGKSTIWGVYAPATKNNYTKHGIHVKGYLEWWDDMFSALNYKHGIVIGDYNCHPNKEYAWNGKTPALESTMSMFVI